MPLSWVLVPEDLVTFTEIFFAQFVVPMGLVVDGRMVRLLEILRISIL